MRLRACVLLVTFVLFAACGTARRATVTEPTPVATRAVGDLLRRALPGDDSTPSPTGLVVRTGPARFELTLTDDNDLHPAGIPVEMTGPISRTLTSGRGGIVSGSVPAGVYRFAVVEGCHAAVLVRGGASARVGLAAGETTRGNLGVLWQHRFGPSSPVTVDRSGDWPVGEVVDVEFAVADRCSDDRAPGKAFRTFAFQTSSNLRITKTPTKTAAADGTSHVFVSCTKEGSIKLDVVDRENPTDRADLVALAIGYGGVPRCV
jgi:hypothetical protein